MCMTGETVFGVHKPNAFLVLSTDNITAGLPMPCQSSAMSSRNQLVISYICVKITCSLSCDEPSQNHRSAFNGYKTFLLENTEKFAMLEGMMLMDEPIGLNRTVWARA